MRTVKTLEAPRYTLAVPVRFRRPGEADWQEGRTVNASRTGVLFATSGQPMPRGTPIELQLALPGASRTVGVVCAGTVVRWETTAGCGVRMAATIEDYRFDHDVFPLQEDLPQ